MFTTMEFTSINEYFYKFYSLLLSTMLLPILGFIGLYVRTATILHEPNLGSDQFLITSTAIIFVWVALFFFFNKKIKSVRIAQGLRQKLEKYFSLTIVRYIVFSLCALVLLAMFYVSNNDLFTLIFIIQLVVSGIVWPTSSKASDDLKLRGDEREMVYYKKDVL
jgi:hypothetical protein